MPGFYRKIFNVQIYLNQTTMALNQILNSRYSPGSGLGPYTTCTHIPLARRLELAVNGPKGAASQLRDWPYTPTNTFCIAR